jgi:NAD(P)H-hydrate epimerase
MDSTKFRTESGQPVPAVTAAEMRDVDQVAVDEYGLELLQMMENAGRNLAYHVRNMATGSVTVLAGSGGNGGGGLCCARHLANRDVAGSVILDREPDELKSGARTQFATLAAMDVPIDVGEAALSRRDTDILVDALVGYGLDGSLRGTTAELAHSANSKDAPVVALDVPSGVNATTGEEDGIAITAERVLTLALPKTGLTSVSAELYLGDIAIPAGVYETLDIPYDSPFDDSYWVALSD